MSKPAWEKYSRSRPITKDGEDEMKGEEKDIH